RRGQPQPYPARNECPAVVPGSLARAGGVRTNHQCDVHATKTATQNQGNVTPRFLRRARDRKRTKLPVRRIKVGNAGYYSVLRARNAINKSSAPDAAIR